MTSTWFHFFWLFFAYIFCVCREMKETKDWKDRKDIVMNKFWGSVKKINNMVNNSYNNDNNNDDNETHDNERMKFNGMKVCTDFFSFLYFLLLPTKNNEMRYLTSKKILTIFLLLFRLLWSKICQISISETATVCSSLTLPCWTTSSLPLSLLLLFGTMVRVFLKIYSFTFTCDCCYNSNNV